MPFPRAKANVYNADSWMPMVISWKNQIKSPGVITSFVSLIDLAPTFLKAVGLSVPMEMAGKEITELIDGKSKIHRTQVFLEREHHAYVRKDNASYPMRAVRTEEFLYIKNDEPELWPAGDPELVYAAGHFGDVDGSASKHYILNNRDNQEGQYFYQMAFDKREPEELYDLKTDPDQLRNVAQNSLYTRQRQILDSLLRSQLKIISSTC